MKLTKPSLTKQNLWKWAVGLLVLGVVAYVGAIINEKRQFSQAEKQIGDVYSKIIDIAGEPDQEFKEKSCGYSSAKLSKGRLGCSVSVTAVFANIDTSFSNKVVEEVSSKLKLGKSINRSVPRVDKNQDFTNPNDKVGQEGNQNLSHALPNIGNLVCDIEYIFPLYEEISERQNYKLKIYISCGGEARAEHYQIKTDY